jgi:ElaB/YqjD/DUF883 family membrane-anchored ribosome-binding protein
MSSETNRIEQASEQVAEDARALIAATANAAEEKIIRARNRLAAAMEAANDSRIALQAKAVESAKAADKAIRANPYPVIGMALGVGVLVGYLLRRRD